MTAKLIFDRDRCKGCELCIAACPKQVLILDTNKNKKGYYPSAAADLESCIACANCAKICPDSVISVWKV